MLAIYAPYVIDTAISFELKPPTEEEFAARIERGISIAPWLVLEQNNQILGYSYATEFRSRSAYSATRETTVYVGAGNHGTGIGRALMSELLYQLRAGGAALAIAGITLPNNPSVGLHERLGFAHVGTFHRVGHKFGEWHDVGFWELPLHDTGHLASSKQPIGRPPR